METDADDKLKRYGLILPGAAKTQPAFLASRNVFGDDSEDSDDDSKKKPILLRPSQNINRQAKISQEKALVDDPTVYQYDEIYDSMIAQKEELKQKNKQEKKPKYIENLLKTANKRKIENERRIERQIQKEREKEGEEFADKEVFVTSAYKKKLEELRLEEEKEKREEYLENIGDVRKQGDLGGFYRHLYEQKLGSIKKVDDSKQDVKESAKSKDDADGSLTPDPTEVKIQELIISGKQIDKSDVTKRNYRKRTSSTNTNKNLSEENIVDSDDDEINRVNITEIHQAKKSKPAEDNVDADSDFSIDESSEEDQPEKHNMKNTKMINQVSFKKPIESETQQESENNDKTSHRREKLKKETFEPEPPKPKIDIWKKRTVGDVFDQALKRYYERKASRGF